MIGGDHKQENAVAAVLGWKSEVNSRTSMELACSPGYWGKGWMAHGTHITSLPVQLTSRDTGHGAPHLTNPAEQSTYGCDELHTGRRCLSRALWYSDHGKP